MRRPGEQAAERAPPLPSPMPEHAHLAHVHQAPRQQRAALVARRAAPRPRCSRPAASAAAVHRASRCAPGPQRATARSTATRRACSMRARWSTTHSPPPWSSRILRPLSVRSGLSGSFPFLLVSERHDTQRTSNQVCSDAAIISPSHSCGFPFFSLYQLSHLIQCSLGCG